jgi:ankyrin repeat protein
MNRIDQELMLATRENNLAEVSRLLRAGANINAKDCCNRTHLHRASCHGHVQVVIELLGHGADIDAKDNIEYTPLHWACYKGHISIVIELLSRGANTEAKDHLGDTPLHYASLYGHGSIVQALLSGGADLLVANNRGRLPIYYAMIEEEDSEVAKCLLQHFYATTTRRLPLHELLHDLTWIRNPTSSGDPPLCTALRRNVLGTDDVVEIVEFLVEQNPEMLKSRDQDGSLPLHVACRRGAAFSIVQSLVDLYKASVKSVTPQGDLPVFLACDIPEPSLETIYLLMKLYPDLVYR